jgi:hypothetical protein
MPREEHEKRRRNCAIKNKFVMRRNNIGKRKLTGNGTKEANIVDTYEIVIERPEGRNPRLDGKNDQGKFGNLRKGRT